MKFEGKELDDEESIVRAEGLCARIEPHLCAQARALPLRLARMGTTYVDSKSVAHPCLSLGVVVPRPDKQIVGDDDVRRFAELINHLVLNGKIALGKLADPVAVSLNTTRVVLKDDGTPDIVEVPPQTALMFYAFSDFTREELNEWLGNPNFIEEGGLPPATWPACAFLEG